MEKAMKKRVIVSVIVLVAIVALLAYYHFVPLWASVVSTGAFLAGGVAGWLARGSSLNEEPSK